MNLSDFNIEMSVTAAWCVTQYNYGDLSAAFRSDEIKPEQDIRDFSVPLKSKVNAVAKLVKSREETCLENKHNINKGRVIIFFPERSLADGILSLETKGFFDENDMLPWDTWFYYGKEKFDLDDEEEFLLAWIPEGNCEMVSAALNSVEHYGSYQWFS